jgi:formylglycine-generating enzyme required for sulfatase activity/uncharacterized caspase-like protein
MSTATRLRLLGLSAIVTAAVLIAPGRSQAPPGKKVALLVGVTHYQRSTHFPDLQYSENDIVKLAEILRSPAAGFSTVRVITTSLGKKKAEDAPTAANIRKGLDSVLKGLEPMDTVLVALAGHGVALEIADPDGKDMNNTYSFFCPSDADLVGVSYATGRCKTLLNFTELFDDLGKCGAGAKLVLVDACRHKVEAPRGIIKRNINVDSVTIPTGVGALFSCKAGEYAHESEKLKHGVFFHFVLEGLRGKALNDDNDVTWLRLREYVTRRVRSKDATALVGESFMQTPHAIDNIPGESPVLIRQTRPVIRAPEKGRPKEEGVVMRWGKDVENSIGMKLVRIPDGKFKMGSPEREAERFADEIQHEVEISKEFWLGIHEVTQQQFLDVMGYNPSYFSLAGKGKPDVKYDLEPAGGKAKLVMVMDTSDFPVENVSWEEAGEFCKKLSARFQERKHGRKYRLPTEAEWEYACRGAHSTDEVFHFGNSLSSREANFDGNYPYGGSESGVYIGRTCKVGSYKANRLGLYDMHGNVGEWCADWYGKDYYGMSLPKDPLGPATGMDRVVRGGSFLGLGQDCRSSYRFMAAPASRKVNVGFRVALVPLGR